jgi:hypothetical protein
MADFSVVNQVNQALRNLLWAELRSQSGLGVQFFDSPEEIHIGPPSAIRESTHRLNIFLYHITEDPHLKNQVPVATATGRQRMAPMALRCHYLITPFAKGDEEAASDTRSALILGKVLEVLYDHSTIQVAGPGGEREDVRIVFETLAVADLAEIWEAIREPFRVSLAYQVRVPNLQSGRERVVIPVGDVREELAEAWS